MQWNHEANAGFSTAKPWLPVPPSYKTHNVADELADPNSVLNFYRQLLKLRHTNPALLDGEYIPLAQNDPNVLMYLRRYKQRVVLIALNMSGAPQAVAAELAAQHLSSASVRPLLTTDTRGWGANATSTLKLDPFSVYIAELDPHP